MFLKSLFPLPATAKHSDNKRSDVVKAFLWKSIKSSTCSTSFLIPQPQVLHGTLQEYGNPHVSTCLVSLCRVVLPYAEPEAHKLSGAVCTNRQGYQQQAFPVLLKFIFSGALPHESKEPLPPVTPAPFQQLQRPDPTQGKKRRVKIQTRPLAHAPSPAPRKVSVPLTKPLGELYWL